MENSFSTLIESANSLLVLLPVKPSFDDIASGLSLYLSLKDKATISCPAPMMVGVNRLIGINKIGSDLGNKNLTIRFAGYDAANIEKVSYDIENGEFRLTVVPKDGFNAPEKEQLALTYAGVSADLVILIGGTNDSDFPILASGEVSNAKIAHIGVRTLVSQPQVMSFAKPGSSVSEVVASLIKNSNLTLDADIATNLVMGIEEGSSEFQSSEVTPDTFEVFAHLLRSGGQRPPKTKLSPMNFPPGSIPGQSLDDFDFPEAADPEGTQEAEQDINPPDDWLQPKVFKGSANQPDAFSENKG
jgi:hypothetical protein